MALCTVWLRTAPTLSEVCDYDGATLIIRDDDREEVIRQRLEAYDTADDADDGLLPGSGVTYYEVESTEGSPRNRPPDQCGDTCS